MMDDGDDDGFYGLILPERKSKYTMNGGETNQWEKYLLDVLINRQFATNYYSH